MRHRASFKAAFAAGAQPAARSLLSQATVVVEEGSDACRVDALARPRPLGVAEPSSRPTLVKTDRGILLTMAGSRTIIGR